MSGIAAQLYKSAFRHNSLWIGGIIVGGFVVERTGGCLVDAAFDGLNSGKQWKDILPAVEARWAAKQAEEAETEEEDE